MILRDGYTYILAAVIVAVFFGVVVHPYAAVPFIVLAFYFAYFFRNPERSIPEDSALLVSPADGKVMEVVSLDDDDFVREPCNKVVIFLSIFDVHINRSPMQGEIKCQQYICGRFKPAYKDSVGFENERHMIGIENDKLRIWVTLDDVLEKGERYGLIRFGSCTEVVMPKSVEVLVKKGDKVKGGETIIGRVKSDDV